MGARLADRKHKAERSTILAAGGPTEKQAENEKGQLLSMLSPDLTPSALAVAIAGLSLTALLSVPHISQFVVDLRAKELYSPLENGDDDEEITTAKPPNAGWQKITLAVVSGVAAIAGLPFCGIATNTSTTSSKLSDASLICLIAWSLVFLQELILATRRIPRHRYRLGCHSAFACLVMGVVAGFTLSANLSRSSGSWMLDSHDATPLIQLVASAVLFFVNLAIPRGPKSYRNGHPVDAVDSVSFLNKYTFSWARWILALAAKKGTLNAEDLPLVGNEVRARTLTERFTAASSSLSLWKKWLRIFWPHVTVQVMLQLVANIIHFLPNLLLLTILRLFEERDNGAKNQLQLWIAAVGLGLALVVVSWFISLRDFVADMQLSLPINEQLFAVITRKAMNLKDIALPAKEDEDDEDDEDDDDDSEDDEAPRSKHSILNLLGVDAETISDFVAYCHLILDCVLELTATIIFLVYLLGWKPTIAGVGLPVLANPALYYLTKRYSESKQELMDRRDEKSSVMTEMVRGIRQIKFSALETEWYNKIHKLRTKELKSQRRVFYFDVGLAALWGFGPLCMSVLSLATYIYVNQSISPSIAFTALSIFDGLQAVLGILPEIFTELLDAAISVKRVEKFLTLTEHEDKRVDGDGISFKNATISWPSSEPEDEQGKAQFQLKDLDLHFPSKGLSVISGRSGAGKSLLLHALIGEADVVDGTLTVPRVESTTSEPHDEESWLINGQIAYVSQDPWIENATIKDSILFGLPLVQPRYNEVLAACALTRDLQILPDRDMTDIGANGINLSGGQKWRLALARALYSRASILILDDIFSAVDSHVGKHLYQQALTGELSEGRTRILATHHVRLCVKGAAYLVALENGRVSHAESPLRLAHEGRVEGIVQDGGSDTLAGTDSGASTPGRTTGTHDILEIRSEERQEQKPKKFYEEEKREQGVVKMAVYKAYVTACGGYLHWILIMCLLVVTLLFNLAAPYWVSLWTRAYEDDAPKPVNVNDGFHLDKRLVYYGGIYVALCVSEWLISIIKYELVLRGSLMASKEIFERFNRAVLQSPLRFLDTTPVGQVLNRFTSDFGDLDSDLADNFSYLMDNVIRILGVFVAALVTSPMIVALGLLCLLASWGVAYFYVTAAREIKRLESTAKSPIFELVGSLLTGLPTIRAFGRREDYLNRMYDLIDAHCQALWHRRLFQCWMAFWLSIVGACFVAAVTIMFVNIRSLDAPLAGFALSFALQMSDHISWLLSQYAQLELDFNAAERIIEYTNLEQEPQSGIDVPAYWPTRGEIEVEDLNVSYAPDQPAVLKDLTFSVRQGERIGIVGRTGAGKSSLAMTLLRCLEVQSGSIHIDGIDISKVRLRDLRSRLGIISQDPVVFAGTIREVLDPFDQHDDSELIDALEKVGLLQESTEDNQPETSDEESGNTFSLTFQIAEGGKNLSQGQRQLLCLARALVSRPKILIMDEATASIDMESDIRIQKTLREEVRGCTLLVIAHRLSTIADFDRVLVLDGGRVAEMDTPELLMGVDDGLFRGMVEQSGERVAIEKMIFGDRGEVGA